jgi:putative DNA primase/helicase
MLAQPDVHLPVLERIVEAPAFAPDGSIQTKPGYHEAARRYYHGNGLVVRPVPSAPSRAEVDRAVELILELLIDFPFVSEADRLNAVAAMLGPIVRDLIPGSTPAHLFEAPTPGTGKGLLADAVAIPATGRPAADDHRGARRRGVA